MFSGHLLSAEHSVKEPWRSILSPRLTLKEVKFREVRQFVQGRSAEPIKKAK